MSRIFGTDDYLSHTVNDGANVFKDITGAVGSIATVVTSTYMTHLDTPVSLEIDSHLQALVGRLPPSLLPLVDLRTSSWVVELTKEWLLLLPLAGNSIPWFNRELCSIDAT